MAAGITIDMVRGLIVRTLMEASAVAAIAGGRVSGAFPEGVDIQDAAYPLVVISMRAGRPNYNPAIAAPVFEVWAYSRIGAGEATALYDACKGVLQAERFSQGIAPTVVLRIVTRETLGATEAYNERTRAWYSHGRWIAQATGS